ncbi:hypothetical protein [Tsuneonella dongtanensis]|uniref:hypothetical protein n=1 Tax=Tsuneonella dongtanensis TaxID=692370 RepID=UPI00082AAB5E|nr:hypothetical protein [Tsuneonella dongtanensis]
MADAVAACHSALGRPVLVGLAGAQGSGKSTMAPRIAALLAEKGLGTAILALDDFYLTREKRKALAETVHPLLATRGVPGTHDIGLLTRAFDALLAGQSAIVPRFDKGSDDRTGTRTVAGPVDVVLLEGWCIGARAQTDAALVEPVNALERDEDADGTWRRWVNRRLATDYAALFDRIDLRILLRAPDFAVVERWRCEQEAHLGLRGMTSEQITRFVQHYERVTRAMLAEEPADLIVDQSPDRVPVAIR